jgi:hypothetical protein
MRPILSLFLLFVWLTNAAAQPSPERQSGAVSPSIIEIPIRMSLAPFSRAAEQAVPDQVGNWHNWKDWHGIKNQYRAWRGPLSIRMMGDVLLMQAHVRYWIKAHKKVLKAFDIKASCGVNEPPRQAVIGILARLRWGPDWLLRPQFQILPTRFLDRCELTFAGIDVTPLVEKVFRRHMKNSLRSALKTLYPRLNTVRHQMERSWFLLQEPIHLGKDNWLLLRPAGVALSPLYGRNDRLDTHLAVILYPKITADSGLFSERRALPPLGRFYPRVAAFKLQLTVELDFADISQGISSSLADRPLYIEGRKVNVEAVNLSGSKQELRAKLRLTGDAAGIVEVWANLKFEPENRELRLHNLKFVHELEEPSSDMVLDLFYERIRHALETTANQLLARQMVMWQKRLVSAFSKVIPQDVRLDLSSLTLRSAQIDMEKEHVRLHGLVAGHAKVELR